MRYLVVAGRQTASSGTDEAQATVLNLQPSAIEVYQAMPNLMRQTSGVETEPSEEHALLPVNEPARRYKQQHAKTESAVSANAAAEQFAETGAILDLEPTAQNRVGSFAFDAAATLARSNRTAQHSGPTESYELGDLKTGGVSPSQLAGEPLGIDVFTKRPPSMRGSRGRRRLLIIKGFEKRVALAGGPVPSLEARSNNRSNARLEIEPPTGGPIHRQFTHLDVLEPQRLNQIRKADGGESRRRAKLSWVRARIAQDLRSLDICPQQERLGRHISEARSKRRMQRIAEIPSGTDQPMSRRGTRQPIEVGREAHKGKFAHGGASAGRAISPSCQTSLPPWTPERQLRWPWI